MERTEQERLFFEHYRMVGVIARRYAPAPDLGQIGALGLWKACLRYEPAKGKFSTFAWRCIRTEIAHEVRASRYAHRKGVPCVLPKCAEHGHLRPEIMEFESDRYPLDVPGPEDLVVDRMMLASFLQGLPRKQQMALLLQIAYALPQVRVARILGCSQKHVSRLVSAGLRRAREQSTRH